MTPDLSVIQKVQKLLALAESKNEHEAALAASKAQELMLRYGIELAQVAALKGGQVGVGAEWLKHVMCDPWRRDLANYVARSMGGRMVYMQDYRKWTGDIEFWGQRDVVPSMVAIYQYLEAQLVVVSATATATREARDVNGMRWRRSFLAGAVLTVGRKLMNQRKEMEEESVDNSMALVVIRDAVKEAMEERYPNMVKGRTNNTELDPDGVRAGREAGHTVDLGNTQVSRDSDRPALTGGG